MKMRFNCHNASCPAIIEYRPLGRCTESLDCPRCGKRYTLNDTAALGARTALERCCLCGGSECFIRKNFPQKVGLLIVVAAAIVSFWSLERDPALSYGVLVGAVVVDVVIYFMVGVVTVCYRCRAEYWGVARNRKHGWFDLSTSEKYL